MSITPATVAAELARLALDDPGGEREAIAPLSPLLARQILEPAPELPTWRTLADVSDDPPGPLLFGMLEDGPTLAYAAPGTGRARRAHRSSLTRSRPGCAP